MKNRRGFVPKRYRQPDYYRLIFNGWCAVYVHPQTGVEYHLQLLLRPWSSTMSDAPHIEVLRQDKDCRRQVSEQLTTIKDAITVVERLLARNIKNEELCQ